jgi:AcrR family transcriptional regulator
VEKALDNRRARGEATKLALMRAAEKLIAERGVENVSIREIVAAAGQKNESALQYHFKNLRGLLRAIRSERSEMVQARRAELLQELLTETSKPSLQQLCGLMVEPTFQLARSNVDFRRYIKAFGHELALIETSPLKAVSNTGGGGVSGQQMGRLLREALPHLDEGDYRRRMEAAIMLCAASMYHHARQNNAFRGRESELFLHSLLDALFGLLGAPVSPNTLALKQGI